MSTSPSRSLDAAIAEHVRAHRKDLRLSQDDVAQRMRELGYEVWTRSIVGSYESDPPRAVSLGELLGLLSCVETSLVAVLGELREPVKVSPGRVASVRKRQPGISVDGGIVRQLVEGELSLRDLAEMMGALSSMVENETTRDAEAKAAKTLGVDPMVIVATSHRLWDRGLTEEREARVADRAESDATARRLQAIRGHVTRELMTELAPKVEATKRRSATRKRGKR